MPQHWGPTPHVCRDRLGAVSVRSLGTPCLDDRDGAVALVPGLGAPGYLLRTVRTCARSGPVRVLDVPGFDDPAGLCCGAALEPLAEVVARWLAVVPPAPVVLAGHSTGAQVALRAALRVPERVRALVLLAPTFPRHLRRMGPLVGAFARTAVHESPGVVPTLLPSYVRAGPRRLLSCIRSAQTDAPEDVLPSVACPVVVMSGEHDALCPPAWSRHLAGRARQGRAVLVRGAHAFPHRHPAATAAVLTAARKRPTGK
ncbi:alpha/beta fold hydrolase [Streptomyces sp. NPDC051207]|uniref:alpha/beta fold hydrolase n=1 Tax=Streptomyces sp. NPDC051207 TaxID=3154641 RepID=UPI0034303A1C